ncbi:efflux RND transporter periplasmic adaptor subunit [Vagococcus sp. JNUCC 83]
MSHKKKRMIMLSCSCLLIIGIAGTVYFKKKEATTLNQSTIEVKKVQDLVDDSQPSKLILSSKIVAKNSQKIKIDPSKGAIKEISVKEGDTVKSGQKLFEYDSDQQLKAKEAGYTTLEKQRNLETAKTDSSLKWDSYNKKLSSLNAAKGKVNQATDEAVKKEAEQEVKTLQDEADQKYSEAILADSAVATAKSELEKSAEMEKIEDQRLTYDDVTSESDGTITYINKELPYLSNEKKQSETFMEVIDKSELYATGDVNEFDKDNVTLNQAVELIDRKDSTKRWKGKVVQVANLSTEGDGKKEEESSTLSKYPYKILLEKGEKMPSLGTHLYAKLLSNSEDAGKIMIPKNYLTNIKGTKASVWKSNNHKATKQSVEFVEKSSGLVEIKTGLLMTDTLIKPNDDVTQGMRVD